MRHTSSQQHVVSGGHGISSEPLVHATVADGIEGMFC
jgi:hypothetical protein